MVSVRQGWRLSFPTVSCLTEQTLSIFLTLPGHRAVDESSVLFCPTPPHHLRQDQAFPSCVRSQRSSLSCPGKQPVIFQGPELCPFYRSGLEPSFAASTSYRGLPLCSPGISLSAFLWRPVWPHGHCSAQDQGACGRRRCWDSPDHCPEPGLSSLGGVSRAGSWGESRDEGIVGMEGSWLAMTDQANVN